MSEKVIVTNPATGDEIQEITLDSNDQINEKINAAEQAFLSFKSTTAYHRADLLEKWHAKILENKERASEIITSENGKPLAEAKGEIDSALSYIKWYAEEAKRIYGRTVPAHVEDKRIIVTEAPIGVVAAITPWNFPGSMMVRKAAPALAAGCTFIVKPALETPLTTMYLIDLAYEAGFSKDVIQYVNTRGRNAGELFSSHKAIKKITFTGSTEVGKQLIRQGADTVKSLTMELGGHAPVIVCQDADLDDAVQQTLMTKFRNAGQTCICANRVIVHESIMDEFSRKLAQKANELVVGNGLKDDTMVGPIINQSSYEKIHGQIKDAVEKGATMLTKPLQDEKPEGSYFIAPTVLKDVTDDMNIMHEETFGPVAPLTSFQSIDEAIAIANNTEYGLAAYFFTNDYRTGIYIHDHLEYGIIGWNDGAPTAAQAPFGGMKESGLGREGGIEGIKPYLETKYLSIGRTQ